MLVAVGYQNMPPQNMTLGNQNMPQNMPLWHKDYFELIILKNTIQKKLKTE